MKYLFHILLFTILGVSNIGAQSIYVKVNLNDGLTKSFPLKDIRKITFSEMLFTSTKNSSKLKNIMKTFSLLQNYPNPFNPTTTIQYTLPKSGDVTVKIFTINGQKIKEFKFDSQKAGIHKFIWDAKNDNNQTVASGLYIYTAKFGNSIISKRMIFIK